LFAVWLCSTLHFRLPFFLQPAETRCVLPAPAWPTLVPSHGCQARARKEPKSLFRRQRCATSTPPARLRTTALDRPPSLIRKPSRSRLGPHSLCAAPERCPDSLPQRKRLLHETLCATASHPPRSLVDPPQTSSACPKRVRDWSGTHAIPPRDSCRGFLSFPH